VELGKQSAALAARRESVQARCAKVESELADWGLFARCMSNDGLIALAIDDAGPALSGLANDLLLACYGPRFTVSIHTLLDSGKGEQKEGFDIVVHDGTTGDAKSMGLMSGGERTWVEACLTRAIALYLATHRPLVVSCGTQQSESLVVVEPGGHVGRLPLSLSTCPRGCNQEIGIGRWSGGAVHQRVGSAATVGG